MSKKFCCLDKMNFYEMCNYCYNAFFSDPDFEAAMHDSYWDEEDNKTHHNKVCECGGGTIANNTHSAWCPMFDNGDDYYGTD